MFSASLTCDMKVNYNKAYKGLSGSGHIGHPNVSGNEENIHLDISCRQTKESCPLGRYPNFRQVHLQVYSLDMSR